MARPTVAAKANKKSIVVGSTAAFAVLALAISIIVGVCVKSVTEGTNRLDDKRSRAAVAAAMTGLNDQIIGLVQDNAIWDDAARAAYEDNDVQWMIENWGVTTLDYPLYSQALVIEADGTPVMAYGHGVPLKLTPQQFFGPTFDILRDRAQLSAGTGNNAPMASAFLLSPSGLTVVGIGPILPATSDSDIDPAQRRYLVLARPISPADIAILGASYVIPGLSFGRELAPGLQRAGVADASGQIFGYMTWPSQRPGDQAFHEIVPYLAAALSFLIVLLVGFFALSKYLVGDMRREKQRAEYQATHDPLSGLLNRAGLFDHLEALMERRNFGGLPTLIYLDLDGFKEVNDTFGHAVGDGLIRAIAQKLLNIAPDGAQIARIGGDEFAITMGESPLGRGAKDAAAAVHALFQEPFDIDGRVVAVGASVGIAMTNSTKIDAGELLRQADLAMYSAKARGGGQTVFHEAGFDLVRAQDQLLEADLRQAIAADELDIAFQPVVAAKTGRWQGFEALARWHNKRLGKAVGPDVFIALAERSGLIERLGLQMLRKALTASVNWPGMKISVNVSPAQFRNPSFPDLVAEVLAETGANPALVTLEITEGFFIHNPDRAQRIVKGLKALGVSISLDDFGAGFSSIGYLRQFDFDRLKIDRSFITALDREANARDVIIATIGLAKAFDIPVTAEGIETEEQAVLLRLAGCDEFQGYLFGRPMPEAEINTIMRQNKGAIVSAA